MSKTFFRLPCSECNREVAVRVSGGLAFQHGYKVIKLKDLKRKLGWTPQVRTSECPGSGKPAKPPMEQIPGWAPAA